MIKYTIAGLALVTFCIFTIVFINNKAIFIGQ